MITSLIKSEVNLEEYSVMRHTDDDDETKEAAEEGSDDEEENDDSNVEFSQENG